MSIPFYQGFSSINIINVKSSSGLVVPDFTRICHDLARSSLIVGDFNFHNHI